MKKEMSYEKFDALCDRFDVAPFKCGARWPTILEIKEYIEPKIEQNLEFLIWIAETADSPKTEAEKESKKYINNLILNTVKFTDNK
jgi:hypothetical protein